MLPRLRLRPTSPTDALDEMRISHVHEYRVVLTTIGTKDAEAVLKRCLLDREFGAEAAVGLQVIWQQRHEPIPEGKFGNWPDFARAAANRSRDRAQTCDIAEVLIAAAHTVKEEGSPNDLVRVARFVGCAVLMPHGDRAAEFDEILIGNITDGVRRELAQRMVVGGLVVPADTILSGLEAVMAEYGDRKWIRDHELPALFAWVELLPMSDRPTAFFVGLDMLGTKFDFNKWNVRNLLGSARYLEEAQRIELLRGLVTRYPSLTTLRRIDAEGDAEGGFDAGPRHPDISSGLPWPVVASSSLSIVNGLSPLTANRPQRQRCGAFLTFGLGPDGDRSFQQQP
ncbi:hypothetical protein [Mesorhizobium sp. M0571]|uniref:hypothetical protein n=1 Tax=Mesorhizobium sp. M0571 TaxID=2956960 RepID=UPI00333666BA